MKLSVPWTCVAIPCPLISDVLHLKDLEDLIDEQKEYHKKNGSLRGKIIVWR